MEVALCWLCSAHRARLAAGSVELCHSRGSGADMALPRGTHSSLLCATIILSSRQLCVCALAHAHRALCVRRGIRPVCRGSC